MPSDLVASLTPSRRRWIVIGLGVTLLLVAAWLSRSTVVDALQALGHADGRWIAGAFAMQLLMYGSLGAMLRRMQEPGGHLGWVTCTEIGLVVFGLGGIMPASPAEGMTVATIELNRRGIPAARAAGTLVLSEWMRFLGLAVLFAIDRVVAALNGRALNLGLGPVVLSSILIVVLVVLAARFVQSQRAALVITKLTNRLPGRGHRDHDEVQRQSEHMNETVLRLLGSPSNRLAIGAWGAIGWLADATCLAMCVKALGDELGLDAVLLAYVLAAAVAIVPFLPGGIGAVEVVVPTVMHRFGIPFDTALGATLAWRGLALIAPALGGLGALVALRRSPA